MHQDSGENTQNPNTSIWSYCCEESKDLEMMFVEELQNLTEASWT